MVKDQGAFEGKIRGLCREFMVVNSLNVGADIQLPQEELKEAVQIGEDENPFDTVFKEEDEKLFKQDDPTTASKASAVNQVGKSKSDASKRSAKAVKAPPVIKNE